MARNRVFFQSENLYISNSFDSTGQVEHSQLHRIQDINYNLQIPRTDVNQYGVLARIDALITKSPSVTLDTSYLLTSGENERALGLYVNDTIEDEKNILHNILLNQNDKNLYIVTASEGVDANDEKSKDITYGGNTYTDACALAFKSVIGIGNAFLTNYSLDLSVAQFPTIKVSFEGANLNSSRFVPDINENFYIKSAAVDRDSGLILEDSVSLPDPSRNTGVDIVSALRPYDVTLDFKTYADFDTLENGLTLSKINLPDQHVGGINVQSLTIEVPIKRTTSEKLGKKYFYDKSIDFPLEVTMNVKALVNEMQAGNIVNLLDDQNFREIQINFKNPKDDTKNLLIFKLKGSTLSSESFTSSIGANKSVDLTFKAVMGAANDTKNGLFLYNGSLITPNTYLYFDANNFVTNADWEDVNNWYIDPSLSTAANVTPTALDDVMIVGSTSPEIDLDDTWAKPSTINTALLTDPIGIAFTSAVGAELNDISIIGKASFYGSAVLR